MGNFPESNKKFLQDWSQVEKEGSPGTFTNVWVQKKGNKKIQMIEYPLHVSSEEDIEEERKIFWMRLNHPQLVSSLYFVDETKNQFCSSNYQGDIFIERIPLTLQTVTDIPFPDALHVYSQSLIGFHVLASEIVKSCFPISEQHIGINCQSICKVWMNGKYERNVPSRNETIHEHAMVRMILDTIEENVDLVSLQGKLSPIKYIYSRSRSPTEVRFDEAINLFNEYVKQFFKGQIPSKMACVDRVGGIYTLSKNWKNRYESVQTAVRNQDPELYLKNEQNSTTNFFNPPVSGNLSQIPESNNYTTFRRQEPVFQSMFNPVPPTFQSIPSTFQQVNVQNPVFQEVPVNQVEVNRVNTPSFSQSQGENVFVGSRVQMPVINQQSRAIQQIVYQDTKVVPAQIVRKFSQSQVKPLIGSTFQAPVTVVNPQRSQVRQSFIQNRVVNGIINPPQAVFVQQAPQPVFIQQLPQTYQQIQQPVQQIPQPVFINQTSQPQPQSGFVQGVAQQVVFSNQQYQPQVGSSQIFVPGQQMSQPLNIVRRSQISFGNQVVSTPQNVSTPFQVGKTTSVYVTPQVINKPQTQRNQNVVERNQNVQRNSPVKSTVNQVNGVDMGLDQTNLRLRNNEESISSINAQTNPVQSNEQLSDKFSMLKEEPIDTSTRNFYTNMMNNEVTSKTGNDYLSSYYANYTSKLYDNSEAQEQVPVNHYISSSKVEAKESSKVGGKYNVTNDDGMSSADFLNQLKNLKSTSPFVKTQNNFDYGFTTYDAKNEVNRYSNPSDHVAYNFDFKNYATTLTDERNHQNDLNIVGSKVDITPVQSKMQLYIKLRSNTHQESPYKISYEYQEGQTPNGNLTYQSQHIQMNGADGSYQEQYYQTTNYQSTFDKYASYGKYNQPETLANNVDQNEIRLGENLQTQFSRNKADQAQYFQATRNTTNTTYNNFSPMHQKSEEEYQVEYDPQILADLQKLKGVN